MYGYQLVNKNLEYETELPIPTLRKETGVVVEVFYAGINPVDYKVMEYGWFIRWWKFLLISKVTGYDFCGKVIRVGKKVKKFKEGDFVCGMAPGAYAQFAYTDVDQIVHLPKKLRHHQGGSFALASETVYQMYQKIIPDLPNNGAGKEGFLKGKSLMVIGASGGCGLFAVLLGKHFFGAKTVYAVCSKKNHEFVRSLGADVCIDYQTEKFEDFIAKDSKDFYGVVDCYGGYEYSKRSVKVLDTIPGSYYTTCGAPNGSSGIVRTVYHKWKWFLSFFGGTNYSNVFLEPSGEVYETILKFLVEKNLFDLIPVKIYRMNQLLEAHEQIKTQSTKGKLCLRVNGDMWMYEG